MLAWLDNGKSPVEKIWNLAITNNNENTENNIIFKEHTKKQLFYTIMHEITVLPPILEKFHFHYW